MNEIKVMNNLIKEDDYIKISRNDFEIYNQINTSINLDDIELIVNTDFKYIEILSIGKISVTYVINIGDKKYLLKKINKSSKEEDLEQIFKDEIGVRKKINNSLNKKNLSSDNFTETYYASYKHLVIFSEFKEESSNTSYTEDIFDSLFETIFSLEKIGLFVSDFSNVNFNKCGEFLFLDYANFHYFNIFEDSVNSKINIPYVHMIERYETTMLFHHIELTGRQEENEDFLKIYEIEKRTLIKYLYKKLRYMEGNCNNTNQIEKIKYSINYWFNIVNNSADLEKNYYIDFYRSLLSSIYSDFYGDLCSNYTLRKCETINDLLHSRLNVFKSSDNLHVNSSYETIIGLNQSLIIKIKEAITYNEKT